MLAQDVFSLWFGPCGWFEWMRGAGNTIQNNYAGESHRGNLVAPPPTSMAVSAAATLFAATTYRSVPAVAETSVRTR